MEPVLNYLLVLTAVCGEATGTAAMFLQIRIFKPGGTIAGHSPEEQEVLQFMEVAKKALHWEKELRNHK